MPPVDPARFNTFLGGLIVHIEACDHLSYGFTLLAKLIFEHLKPLLEQLINLLLLRLSPHASGGR
jgi:hypothetical protein